MASVFTNNLRLNEMGTGDQSGTWGVTTNTNLQLIGEALGYGTEAISTNATAHSSEVADGTADAARAMYVKYTGTLNATCTITITPNTMKRVQIVENATSGGQSIIVKQGSGTTVTIPNGTSKVCVLDGSGGSANVIDALNNLAIGGDLTIGGDDLKMATNTAGHFLVGDGTNYNPVAMSGDATLASNGAITIANDAVGADQLASDAVVNASISASAGIAFSKMENLTTSRALVSDGNGDVSVSAVTATEVGYLDGVTSAIQTQLNNLSSGKLGNTVNAWHDSSDSVNRLYFVQNGATLFKTATEFQFRNASDVIRASIDASGNGIFEGNVTAYGSASDLKLKENVEVIPNALEKVKELKGVNFAYKKDGKRSTGLIAQDLQKVLPEAVYTSKDLQDEEHLAIRYGNTVGLLVEAIKDLSKQVETIKNGTA